MTFYDLHTHYPPKSDDTVAIVNWYWPQPERPAGRFSAGLHPWYFTDPEKMSDASSWLAQASASPDCVAIGEAGLDRVVKTDWSTQLMAFECCIELAISLRKPLILHCVRAFDDVLAIKKRLGNVAGEIPWIFHGFNKKPDIARKLLDAGCYLSFGAALPDGRFPAADALRICADDCFFLETDDRADISIRDIYAAAAVVRGVSMEEIGRQVEMNFQKWFS